MPSRKAGPNANGCIFLLPVIMALQPDVGPVLPAIVGEDEGEEDDPMVAPKAGLEGTLMTLDVDLLACFTPKPFNKLVVELFFLSLSPFTCNPPYLRAGSSNERSSLSR